jgi:predicted dehydrogenase
MQDPVRVGLIGCGNIGGFHSRNLRNLVRSNALPLQFTAVCDRKQARADEFARLVGAQDAGTDALALVESPRVDAVYICTETSEHPQLLAAALAAGKHVFCEKPLACSLAEAQAMHDAVTRAGVVHQVGLVLNHSPVFGVLEHLMRTEDVGRLLTAHLRDDQFLPVRGHYNSTWRADVAKAGGGTLIEHSIHDVDLLRRLFGEVTSVRCTTRHMAGIPGIEDVALVRFVHAGGGETTLSSVWHDIDERPSTRRFEAFFERGWFCTEDDYIGSITWQPKSGKAITLSADEVTAKFLEIEGLDPDEYDVRALAGLGDRRFIAAVREGRPAHPDFATALASHRIVDACYRSAAEGRDVAL